MRTDSPISVLAGEDLEPNRRILFNGTNWMLADAYEVAEAVTGGSRIPSGRFGYAYTTNEDGIYDITAAGSIAAGAAVNAKDDGKCDDDGLGLPIGRTSSSATVASGDPCPVIAVVARRGLVSASVAASANIAAQASSADAAFDKTFVFAANTLKAGDAIDIWAQVDINTANSTDTFTHKIKIGTTVVALSPTIDAVTGDICVMHARVQIRTAGASGTLVASALCFNGTGAAAAGAADIPSGSSVASTTIDTTAAQTVTVTVSQSANSANDISILQMLQVIHFPKS